MKILPLPSYDNFRFAHGLVGSSTITKLLIANYEIVQYANDKITLRRKGSNLTTNASGAVTSTVEGYSFYIRRSVLSKLWTAAEKQANEGV